MALTLAEKERINDNRLKIQSVAESLNHLGPNKVPDFEEIQQCLGAAEKSLSRALRS